MPLDRGDTSDDLTDFSSINGPLRAVKGTEERDDRTLTSSNKMASPQLLLKRFFMAFISPESTHAAGSR
jgi:hypothetical protein